MNRTYARPLATVHPRTGEPLVPIGYVDGRPVWPVLGASQEDESNDDGAGTEDQDPDGDEDESTQGATDDGDDEDQGFDLERALKKIRKLNSENRSLREREKNAKTSTATEKDAQIKALAKENLQIKIGARSGLPENLWSRLQGDTEEELLTDAEELLGVLGGKKPPTGRPKERLRGGGDPTEEPDELNPAKLAALIPRR